MTSINSVGSFNWQRAGIIDLEAIAKHVKGNSVEYTEPNFAASFQESIEKAINNLPAVKDLKSYQSWLSSLPGVRFKFTQNNPAQEASPKKNQIIYDLPNVARVTFQDFDYSNQASLKDFSDKFQELQTKEKVILDLRGQMGVNGLVAAEVMQKLFGLEFWNYITEKREENTVQTWRVSKENLRLIQERTEGFTGQLKTYYVLLAERMKKALEEKPLDNQVIEMLEPDFDPSHTTNPKMQLTGQVYVMTDSSYSKVLYDLVERLKLIPGIVHIGKDMKAMPSFGEALHSTLPSNLATASVCMKKITYKDGRGYFQDLKADFPTLMNELA